jgi:hypothetical protein
MGIAADTLRRAAEAKRERAEACTQEAEHYERLAAQERLDAGKLLEEAADLEAALEAVAE